MSQSALDDEDVVIAKHTAEGRIIEHARQLVESLVPQLLGTIDMVVYTSCGGNPQKLLALAIVDNVCDALDQNPIDLLEEASKNRLNPAEDASDDAGS